jgi:cytochrome c oxidase subunit 1/cytochrome c oxidase subunit I+III
MFAVGLSTASTVYFAAASLIIVIPSGIQLFAWIITIVTGRPHWRTPLLFVVGFIVFFLMGGLTGVMFAAIPFDQQLTDTYFVVAHFHFVIFGAAVFPILGGMYYWFPKVTGRMYNERLGQASFFVTFVGTLLLFFPMHILGLVGMPRRNYTYPSGLGWDGYNLLESIGGYILTVGLLMIAVNLLVSLRRGEPAGNDPFEGDTLEWSTTSPPPAYNYAVIPTVSSPYAMWDKDDRERDLRQLERGDMTLQQGHETQATTVVDAEWDEVLDMPSDSPWPLALAAAVLGIFAMLLGGHLFAAGVFALLAVVAVVKWHSVEPQQA